jgi:hypothetical protein
MRLAQVVLTRPDGCPAYNLDWSSSFPMLLCYTLPRIHARHHFIMSAEQFPITAAQLAGNFCETLFYGMYLVTCGFCARSLLFTSGGHGKRWLRTDEIRWMTVVISSLLFIICTFNLFIGLLHNFRAFVKSDNPEKEFLNLGDWINITRVCISMPFFCFATLQISEV